MALREPKTNPTVECYECKQKVPEKSTQSVDIFPQPWDETSTKIHLCCGNNDENNDENDGISCYERFFNSDGDFPYQECNECLRLVCFRNPQNGYMGQFRTAPKYHKDSHKDSHKDLPENDSSDEEPEEICLSCYEQVILKRGQPMSNFCGDRIKGGMFYSAIEWGNAGYQNVDSVYIRYDDDAAKYNKRARDLIDEGAQVITGFDSIGMGLEGYISMFARFPSSKEPSSKEPYSKEPSSKEPSSKKSKK